MSTHNICFYGEITKIIPKLSSNTLLICSTEEDILTLNGPFTTDYDHTYPEFMIESGYLPRQYIYLFIAIALDETSILVAVHFSMKNIYHS